MWLLNSVKMRIMSADWATIRHTVIVVTILPTKSLKT